MATMVDQKPKYHGESTVWDAIKNNLPSDWICYWNRNVSGYETDCILLIPGKGLAVIEVKGWNAKNILKVTKDEIEIDGYFSGQMSPEKQVRNYRFNLLNFINKKFGINPAVIGLVCFPKLTEEEYFKTRLDVTSSPNITLFKDDLLSPEAFQKKILREFELIKNFSYFGESSINLIRKYYEPEYIDEVIEPIKEETVIPDYSITAFLVDQLQDQEINSLIENYFNGTKLIIFTSDADDKNRITNKVKEMCLNYNLQIDQTQVRFGYNFFIEGNEEQLQLFNLQVFYVPNIVELIERNTLIKNGEVTEITYKALKKMDLETSFNLGQYLTEHSTTQNNTQVTAGAGTGKTFTMVSKISYLCLVPDSPVTNPENDIALMTFTNEAANNMKERLENHFISYYRLTGKQTYLELIEKLLKCKISTIAKFCVEILQSSSIFTGLGSEFSIRTNKFDRDKFYQKYLDQTLIELNRGDYSGSVQVENLPVPMYELKNTLMELADKALNKSIDLKNLPSEVLGTIQNQQLSFFTDLIERTMIRAEAEFESSIHRNNQIELNRILSEILNNSRKDEIISQLPFKYLMIDEFQDTDDKQIELFHLIQEKGKNHPRFFVVGDLKQSIYRFRGATMSAFTLLQKKSEYDWSKFTLTKNYRSRKDLLEKYSKIFEYLGEQDYLPYQIPDDVLVGRVIFNDGFDDSYFMKVEADRQQPDLFYDAIFEIVQAQKKHIENNIEGFISDAEKTIAILVRTNRDVERILIEGKKRNFDIQAKTDGNLYHQESTYDLLKLINALLYNQNPLYLTSFLETNYFNVKINYSKMKGLNDEEKLVELTKIIDNQLNKTLKMSWKEVIKTAQNYPSLYVLHLMFSKLKPYQNLSSKSAADYKNNYESLIENLIQLQNIDSMTLVQIQKYLEIQMLADTESAGINPQGQSEQVKIICTTVHKSKGLEFGIVILPFTFSSIEISNKGKTVVDFDNQHFAYFVSIDPKKKIAVYNDYFDEEEEKSETIKEESRILYVAMTRAIHKFIWVDSGSSSDSILCWKNFLEKNYAV